MKPAKKIELKYVQSRKSREHDIIFLSEPVPSYRSDDYIGPACQKIGLTMSSFFQPENLKPVTLNNECIYELEFTRKKGSLSWKAIDVCLKSLGYDMLTSEIQYKFKCTAE